jgi:tetratricopeptide (TPR) repeat protein
LFDEGGSLMASLLPPLLGLVVACMAFAASPINTWATAKGPNATALQTASDPRFDRIAGEVAYEHGLALMKEAVRVGGRQFSNGGYQAKRESIELYREAIPYLELAVRHGPNEAKRVGSLAVAYAGAGERQMQIELLAQGIVRFPRDVNLAVLYASALMAAGRYREALSAADHLHSLDPEKGRSMRRLILIRSR